jgi:transcription-repair coupling factor (superfamily II helicase)
MQEGIETTPATLLAGRLIEQRKASGLILAARGEARAARIANAAAALAPDLSVALLPGWDCLPFDRVSPSRAVMGQRMAALRRLASRGPHLLVAPIDALTQRLPPPDSATFLTCLPANHSTRTHSLPIWTGSATRWMSRWTRLARRRSAAPSSISWFSRTFRAVVAMSGVL